MQRFFLPTEIITGQGSIAQLGGVAARFGERVLVVCDAYLARHSPLLARVTQLLHGAKLWVTIYDNVAREPELPSIEEAIALARRDKCQVVIGLGGGSAIDTAKSTAGLLPLPGTIWDYHGGRKLEGPGVPFIAIPTTAGTGAEVTKNAVLIDPRTAVKKSVRDDAWFARVAIVDPELTVSMPPAVTASTGSDALCQCIESYISIGASPLTDGLARQGIEMIGQSLLRAYTRGDDLAAREGMSMGSLMSGIAMVNARLGAVHGMAHPLGSHFHIPHGIICGLLLPYTMEFNLPVATAKFADVARLLGENVHSLSEEAAAQRAVARVRELVTQVGVPMHMAPFGVTEESFPQIIAESLPSESLKHNPRPLTAEDVRGILLAAL